MTEGRKQELRQLLQKIMESLKIVSRDGGSLPVAEYGEQLRERWASYSAESISVKNFSPSIVTDETTLKLRALIRSELEQFINEDRIVSATHYVTGGFSDGLDLNSLLFQLLKITIARGIEEAVLIFENCTKDTYAPMQCVALLEGIKLEAATQVFEGVRLVPVPDSPSVCSSYLPRVSLRGISEDFYYSQTLLIIDYTISPMFHKPVLPPVAQSEKELFRLEVSGGELPDFNEPAFFQKFSGALSLACNSPVQISMKWDLLPEDAIVPPSPSAARYLIPGLFGKSTEAGKSDIEKAKCLYHILNKNSNVSEKLQIPINRWIRSKIITTSVDKMIDLGIAFEALYVPDGSSGEIRFKLAVHAAWHLGKDKEDRRKLMKEFKEIYDWRSKVVHTGKLPEKKISKKKRRPYTHEEVTQFIGRAQHLCRKSIKKILEDGVFPDWNNLILDGEAEN